MAAGRAGRFYSTGVVAMVAALVLAVGTHAKTGQRVAISGLNFSIVLPNGWVGASIPEHPTAADIKRIKRDHPNIAAFLESPLARLFHPRFIANPPTIKGQFTPNLNVVVQAIPKGESLHDFFFSGNSAAAQYVGKTENVRVGSLQALHYWSTKIQKYGTTALLSDIVMVRRGNSAYEFTFTSLASAQSKLQPAFDQSEASIASG